MSNRKMVNLNEEQYQALVRAKASHELATGEKLSGFGATIALLATLYLLGKQQPGEQQPTQRKPIMGEK